MRRFKGGRSDAAAALYVRYAKRLQHLANHQSSSELSYRVSSEEIVQSVFRTFFRRAGSGQYDVADGDDLWKLFLVIAFNKIRKASEFHHARKRDVHRTRSFDHDFLETESVSDGNQEVAHLVLKMTVDECLEDLPVGHADIVRMRIEGHTLRKSPTRRGGPNAPSSGYFRSSGRSL